MPREGLPLKTTGEPKQREGWSSVSDIFEFTPEEGKEYFYKEVRLNSRSFYQYRGETLERTAALMDKVYKILRRHLGDYLVPTRFLLAENKNGQPSIMMVQEKVKGKTVDSIIKEQLPEELSSARAWELTQSLYGVPPDVIRQREEIAKRLERAEKDPELIKLFRDEKLTPECEGKFFTGEVMYRKNQIVDESGHVRVVDW